MMATPPSDQGSDAMAEGGEADGDSEADAAAASGSGGEEEMPNPDVENNAEKDLTVEMEDQEDEDVAPLSLLAHGDSLPLSYRSDNGTRESEFFVGDENEHVNPYYDVVRRLSPTELIGRFMKTSSPKVREKTKIKITLVDGVQQYVLVTEKNCEAGRSRGKMRSTNLRATQQYI